ncbi:MAG: hypothetical protein RLZ75_1760 [Pseudomonadota bacterium]|jgi:hypothetical protein
MFLNQSTVYIEPTISDFENLLVQPIFAQCVLMFENYGRGL